ncbi:MAG TPA: alpha/beta hydrolase [Candidatus Saccharibacteria bacterium]|nr:alpha/beta hydrolase [Candidatus Saccharibacteria bacterium]
MSKIFIIHGTEGHPKENWFPWLKEELEQLGHTVTVPQFPSPPIVPSKVEEWFAVFEQYMNALDDNTVIIGHSLGGVFSLRILEKLSSPIKAAVFVGTPVGIKPILNYERDMSFSGFDFDWDKIKLNANKHVVYQSDDDPYVSLGNGEELAERLGVKLDFVPNSGHFNTKAGYNTFEQLLTKLRVEIL